MQITMWGIVNQNNELATEEATVYSTNTTETKLIPVLLNTREEARKFKFEDERAVKVTLSWE